MVRSLVQRSPTESARALVCDQVQQQPSTHTGSRQGEFRLTEKGRKKENIKFRRMRWAGYVSRRGERRDLCMVLLAKLEGRKQVGRPRLGWEDNKLVLR